MSSSTLTRRSPIDIGTALFPPPRFLRMQGIGIDISEDTIKYVGLSPEARGVVVSTFGAIALPKGIVSAKAIEDKAQLVAVLKKLRREVGNEFAHVSLPEEHAYLFQTEVPSDATPAQIQTVIEFQMKENVPLSPGESLFDYEVLPHLPAQVGMKKISVAVYPNTVIADYLEILRGSGITPLSLEMEGAASARAFVPKGESETVLIVDIGKTKAGISIVSGGTIVFTATLDVGGDDLTNAIQKDTGVSLEEAEAIKRERGFLKGKDSVFAALLSTMSVLRDEILRHARYWQEHAVHEGKQHSPIERVILCGGNANIVGIVEYLSASLKMPVSRGDLWINVSMPDDYVPPISASDAIQYGTAMGLALRSSLTRSLW